MAMRDRGPPPAEVSNKGLQTEFPFTLPRGYVDKDGSLHRDGVMRLATARDEMKAASDPRVARNQSYLVVILLAQVVTKLGSLSSITTGDIEGLFASDLRFLEALYEQVNGEDVAIGVKCPSCGHRFDVDITEYATGES